MKTRHYRKPRDKRIGHDRPIHPRYSLAVTYRLFRVYEKTQNMGEVRRVMKECGVFEPLDNGGHLNNAKRQIEGNDGEEKPQGAVRKTATQRTSAGFAGAWLSATSDARCDHLAQLFTR